MNNREIELAQLGFEANNDQQTYYQYKFGNQWYVDFYKIVELSNDEWYTFIECLKHVLKEAKNILEQAEYYILGYSARKEEEQKKLKDIFNKYNSWLKQETTAKLTKTINQNKVLEYQAKLDLIKEIMNGKRQ